MIFSWLQIEFLHHENKKYNFEIFCFFFFDIPCGDENFEKIDILRSKLTFTLTCHHDRHKIFHWRNDQSLIDFVMNIIATVMIREKDSLSIIISLYSNLISGLWYRKRIYSLVSSFDTYLSYDNFLVGFTIIFQYRWNLILSWKKMFFFLKKKKTWLFFMWWSTSPQNDLEIDMTRMYIIWSGRYSKIRWS